MSGGEGRDDKVGKDKEVGKRKKEGRGERKRRGGGWRGLRREEILIREKWLGSPNLIPMP